MWLHDHLDLLEYSFGELVFVFVRMHLLGDFPEVGTGCSKAHRFCSLGDHGIRGQVELVYQKHLQRRSFFLLRVIACGREVVVGHLTGLLVDRLFVEHIVLFFVSLDSHSVQKTLALLAMAVSRVVGRLHLHWRRLHRLRTVYVH